MSLSSKIAAQQDFDGKYQLNSRKCLAHTRTLRNVKNASPRVLFL